MTTHDLIKINVDMSMNITQNESNVHLSTTKSESKEKTKKNPCIRGCKERCLRICKLVDENGQQIKLRPPKRLQVNRINKATKRKEEEDTLNELNYIIKLQTKLRKLDEDQKNCQLENQRLKEKVKSLSKILSFINQP
ncbi:hypothetical protein K502DRAFT_363517 [Neoconidiobolus thromboides FSU 785]|nr:hypothetical protein K502DRAFT_363517 [Neoconidiobolus thromboides FSU 785]